MPSIGTLPSSTLVARSLIDAVLAPDIPAARISASPVAITAAAETTPPPPSTNLPWIAAGPAPDRNAPRTAAGRCPRRHPACGRPVTVGVVGGAGGALPPPQPFRDQAPIRGHGLDRFRRAAPGRRGRDRDPRRDSAQRRRRWRRCRLRRGLEGG